MWSASCFVLLVSFGIGVAAFSSFVPVRRPRESSVERVILNTTNVFEVQLTPGSSSLKYQVCHKPRCNGLMTLWFSATGTDPESSEVKKGFCFFKYHFLTGNTLKFEDCVTGEISSSQQTFFSVVSPNPCGLDVSEDRRLKVQLDSLVDGCEISVTNGALWTEPVSEGNSLKLGLAIGIPIGLIVVISVITLFVVFVGRPWWKKRKAKKQRVGTTQASKDPAKRGQSVAPVQVQPSACAVTPAIPPASSATTVQSVPAVPSAIATPAAAPTPSALPASSVPVSSAPPPSSAPPASSAPATPAVPQTPAAAPSSVVPSFDAPGGQKETPKPAPKRSTPAKIPRLQKDLMPSFDDLSPTEENNPAKASKDTQPTVDAPQLAGPTQTSNERAPDSREPVPTPQPQLAPPPRIRGNMEPGVYRQPEIPRAVDRDGNPRSEAVVAFEEYEVQ